METYEEKIVRYADIMAINSNYKNIIDTNCIYPMNVACNIYAKSEELNIITKELNKEVPSDRQFDPFNKMMAKLWDDLKLHFLNNKYMDEPKLPNLEWVLNDDGILMKKLGGHKKYLAYKNREFRATVSDQNSKIYWWFREVLKWAIVAFLGYCLRYLTELKNTQSTTPQSQQTIQKEPVSPKLVDKDTTH